METPMIKRTESAMWVALAIAGLVVCAPARRMRANA
jgi:hypothetical protein